MNFSNRRHSISHMNELVSHKSVSLNSQSQESYLLPPRSVSPLLSPSPVNPSPFAVFNDRTCLTEQDELFLFHNKIIESQEKSILPLAHDISDWLNKLLDLNSTPFNLLEHLENGVALCSLAKYIENHYYNEYTKRVIQMESSGASKQFPKSINFHVFGKIRYNARKGSFFARDNIAIFIHFCRQIGVHSNLIFETVDLVPPAGRRPNLRSIIICLMEVSRIVAKFGIAAPSLVDLEKELQNDFRGEMDRKGHNLTSRFQTSSICSADKMGLGASKMTSSTSTVQNYTVPSPESLPFIHLAEESAQKSLQDLSKEDELDIKISQVTLSSKQRCSCNIDENTIRHSKISEGKYLIHGKTVFVRLLKGIHVMVRVGGGWETLEDFLLRNDPCRRVNLGSRFNRRSLSAGTGSSSQQKPSIILLR